MILSNVKNSMAALEPIAITDTDYAAKGFHLDVQVTPDQVVDAVEVLNQEAFTLEAVTGVDLLTFDKAAKKKPAKKTAKKESTKKSAGKKSSKKNKK